MSLLDKLKENQAKYKAQMQRGKEVSQQMKDKKQRDKLKKAMDRKPGAIKAITDGIVLKKTPWQVMRDEYNRRKFERENKE